MKISEAKEKGEGSGKFFTTKDIVGQPFEITEDKNALSEFREFVKEPKEPGGKRNVWMALEIRIGTEQKDCHFTNSALRSLRDCMPPGISTWKGQRAVINSLAAGFKPTKITRLMGDYSMPRDQQQLGQLPAQPQPQVAQTVSSDPILAPIIEKLKYGQQSFFKDGIPLDNVLQTCVTPANFQALKDKRFIYEPTAGFFKVV